MNQYNDVRMNIKEMTALCFAVSGIPYGQIRVIAHEVIPAEYAWRLSYVHPQDAQQVNIMPAPVESLFGTIVEYIGADTLYYKTGEFYECHYMTPYMEYIDFWDMYEPNPRKRHKIRKLQGKWSKIF